MFLIVTAKDDITSDYLIQKLTERSIEVFRFHPEDILKQFDVQLRVGSAGYHAELIDTATDRILDLSTIKAAYFRKPKLPNEDSLGEFPDFSKNEIHGTLSALWSAVPTNAWLNHPSQLRTASDKFRQLVAAREAGFTIPETLIDTRSHEILSFMRARTCETIGKAISIGTLDPSGEHVVFTSSMTQNDVLTHFAARVIPMLLQERIMKAADIRVTVIGQKVFGVAIYSKDNQAIDWRLESMNSPEGLRYETITLPAQITTMCIDLTSALGLRFSCIDLLLDRKNKYCFLEVNPNGNWAWLESKLGIPLRDAIIDLLLNNTR